ncbi:MAG: hypothetical protein GXO02_02770 [Epsilonproteobacteria bacterium]|nr:hypothetical protein [Campylobacterota bacterium]
MRFLIAIVSIVVMAMANENGNLTLSKSLQMLENKQLSKEEMVDKLMEISGINFQIENFVQKIQNQVLSSLNTLPPEAAQKVEEALLNAYDENSFKNSIKKEILKALSPSELKELLLWYKGELGTKVTEVENIDLNDEDYQLIFDKIKDLNNTSPSRKELIKELIQKNKTLDFAKRLRKALMRVAISLYSPYLPKEEIDKIIERRFKGEEKRLEDFYTAFYLYIYNKLSDKDLKGYIDFISKSSYQALKDSFENAFIEKYIKSSREFFSKLKEISIKNNKMQLK